MSNLFDYLIYGNAKLHITLSQKISTMKDGLKTFCSSLCFWIEYVS